MLATAYLTLVPAGVHPGLPPGTSWYPVESLPRTALDHDAFIEAAVARLRAKLSYTNIGFALAPPEFTMSTLRDIFTAALGYEVGATNLHRVLTRRQLIAPCSSQTSPGRQGGRPARLFRFTSQELTVSDPFAVLKPPTTTGHKS